MSKSFETSFTEIMERHQASGCARDFHAAVNVMFHEHESTEYDAEHRDMWDSLPPQFSLLIEDWLDTPPTPAEEIHVLDIGCGTGLASQSLIRSPIGHRIRSVTLLDTSPAMLERASARAARWKVPHICRQGTIESLDGERRYDLIVTSSVLHHIPDLPSFLKGVRHVQADGGVFMHLQDPNGDYWQDPELLERMGQFQKPPEWLARFAPKRIWGRIVREWTGKQGQDYVSRTNQALLRQGVISTPLSVDEIYTITDVHVWDEQGISIRRMAEWMEGYDCISRRSYGFFGRLASTLPSRCAEVENRLIEQRALNGYFIGALWRVRPGTALG